MIDAARAQGGKKEKKILENPKDLRIWAGRRFFRKHSKKFIAKLEYDVGNVIKIEKKNYFINSLLFVLEISKDCYPIDNRYGSMISR